MLKQGWGVRQILPWENLCKVKFRMKKWWDFIFSVFQNIYYIPSNAIALPGRRQLITGINRR